MPAVVAVKEGYKLAPSLQYANISGIWCSAVLHLDQSHTRVNFRTPTDFIDSPVRGTVVDHQIFEVVERLTEYGVNRLANVWLNVVRWSDHCYSRRNFTAHL